jgi:AcrR family transcriptional regulator
MNRTYTLKKRAESRAETRRRIIEATVELHATVGPANTTISMIAEKAGVQRNTFYAHFPDEWSVVLACSGHVMENDPLPEPEAWAALKAPEERLRTGLRAIYDWYARHEELLACVLRDAKHHELTRKITELRFGPPMARYLEVLGVGLKAKQRAMLTLALSYHTWRTLARDAGLKQGDAVSAMVRAIAV